MMSEQLLLSEPDGSVRCLLQQMSATLMGRMYELPYHLEVAGIQVRVQYGWKNEPTLAHRATLHGSDALNLSIPSKSLLCFLQICSTSTTMQELAVVYVMGTN